MFQYPYSHSTYFTRTTEDDRTSELPPMNSTEDVLQIQFMHDRMMAHDEDDKYIVWQRISRFTRDIKRGFRSSLQAIAPSKKSKRRISVQTLKGFPHFTRRELYQELGTAGEGVDAYGYLGIAASM
ncbi:hypothetical protein FA13DRAFT_1708723 [Coprinellus micaceus]|uniref:Uncharacterized protein n=1 Tax=Coprinellus micaceus TaxID=71717 RepID=A0A4Y7TEW6_COPMI|nr:hypothetical protein FA13DRAFT_1708723 [Coprinellus micaceus]